LSIDGLTLLDKPAGVTSFSALGTLKKKLGTRRIGHTGTLDKFATGLLIVLIGRYTKLADLFSGLDKCYEARFILGKSTDTLDPEGQIIEEGAVPDLQAIKRAAAELTGTIQQVPPVYSAVHVSGQRAYRIARSGVDPKLEPRRVTIRRIEVAAYRAPELDLVVECSKGTYVRALARDLGRIAGSCAFVQSLRRTKVGPYEVSDAVDPESFSGVGETSLQHLSRLDGIEALAVRDEMAAAVRNGRKLEESFFVTAAEKDGLYTLLGSKGALLGLVIRTHGEYRYKMVL
jgi:tRNA pseudouridine55 synthase